MFVQWKIKSDKTNSSSATNEEEGKNQILSEHVIKPQWKDIVFSHRDCFVKMHFRGIKPQRAHHETRSLFGNKSPLCDQRKISAEAWAWSNLRNHRLAALFHRLAKAYDHWKPSLILLIIKLLHLWDTLKKFLTFWSKFYVIAPSFRRCWLCALLLH